MEEIARRCLIRRYTSIQQEYPITFAGQKQRGRSSRATRAEDYRVEDHGRNWCLFFAYFVSGAFRILFLLPAQASSWVMSRTNAGNFSRNSKD